MSKKFKGTLTLEVEYESESGNVDPRELKWLLDQIVNRAMGEGMVTGDTDATLESWHSSANVKEV